MAGSTSKTFNQDVLVFARKLDRAIDEMGKSASGRDTDFLEADQKRLKGYLLDAQQFLDYASSTPVPDYAETHAMEFELPEPPQHPSVENEMVQLAMNQLYRLRQEIAIGQTSRRAAGIHERDKERADALLQRATDFVDNYVEAVNPPDYPASAPGHETGRTPRQGA